MEVARTDQVRATPSQLRVAGADGPHSHKGEGGWRTCADLVGRKRPSTYPQHNREFQPLVIEA
jgi:hypothetical protein